jgi:hypothetical protein
MFEGVNQLCLLPITQELQIDAQAFFWEFIGLLQQIMLELQLADIALEGLQLLLEFVALKCRRRGFAAFHR